MITTTHTWMHATLILAATYNLAWGSFVILFPRLPFQWAGLEEPNYPQIWQCVGMIVGVYGIGYAIAAGNPLRHWPIVLVGLLGKLFGPLGFLYYAIRGELPWIAGWTIVTNDLAWWIPFGLILHTAYRAAIANPADGFAPPIPMAAPVRCERFVKECRIKAGPEVVFQFHESPDALRHLIPPWEKMTVAESSGSLRPGSKVVLRGRVGLLAVQWVAVHTEYEPPHLFADRQESGPFAWWYHRHRFLDDGQGGTVLRDEVDYQAPLGVIGRLLGGWLIRRKLERMFAYRHEKTRRMIESGEWIPRQLTTPQTNAEAVR